MNYGKKYILFLVLITLILAGCGSGAGDSSIDSEPTAITVLACGAMRLRRSSSSLVNTAPSMRSTSVSSSTVSVTSSIRRYEWTMLMSPLKSISPTSSRDTWHPEQPPNCIVDTFTVICSPPFLLVERSEFFWDYFLYIFQG